MARYPVLVDLAGRPCLVVGGGAVATRKVLGLLEVDARVTVLAPTLAAPLATLAEQGRIGWRSEAYAQLERDEGGAPWAFVIAATDQPPVNQQVALDAARAGTWANVATAPDGGPAALPATWRSDDITVAVSTGGAHPGAARWLRDRLAASVPAELATALALVDEVRAADAAAGGPGRRPDWRSVVDSGTLELIRAGQLAEAKERLQACLSSSSD